jgi:25S rRNA (adenine2142-N1)-methyltransferase
MSFWSLIHEAIDETKRRSPRSCIPQHLQQRRMGKSRSKARTKLLSHTRPPITASQSNIAFHQSSNATRTTIRRYHTLQKRLSQAIADGDDALAASLNTQLSASGGLEAYQAASTLGQSAQRGGDTSRVLMEWLQPVLSRQHNEEPKRPLRILEVGALSTANALNMSRFTDVRCIDLRSNAPGIEEQDFMTLPSDQTWKGTTGYDVLSLSLVVNFVGDASGRGEMLKRTTRFLSSTQLSAGDRKTADPPSLPALFLVLPLPCVDNSRYLNEDKLAAILESLGYEMQQAKRSNKLYYSLWHYNAASARRAAVHFKKVELRTGSDRNNFCIVLD